MWNTRTYINVTGLRSLLKREFIVKLHRPVFEKLDFLDGFGQVLQQKNRLLYRRGDKYFLDSTAFIQNPDPVEFDQSLPASAQVRIYRDLPEGELRSFLKKNLGYRALIPIASVTKKVQQFELKNEDAKTVIRFYLTGLYTSKSNPKPFVQYFHFNPLRGYKEDERKIIQMLDKSFGSADIADVAVIDPLSLYYDTHRLRPVAYHNKPDFAMASTDKARKVVNKYVLAMLKIMKANESGIRQDIDTEFLHDFRVSLRKTRSLVSLLKGVYTDDFVQQLNPLLSQLTRKSNELRDLDVYLLEKDHYKRMLPEELQIGLDPMFDEFLVRRNKEHKAISRYLGSRAYQDLMTRIEQLIRASKKLGKTRISNKAIKDLASRKIYRQYVKICRIGDRIRPDSPDADVHRLRIECKKLRYLLEFFGALFERKFIRHLVSQLKQLQEILGRYNDICVQKENLFEFLHATKTSTPVMHQAIGALIGVMHNEKSQLLLHIDTKFFLFNNKTTRETFSRLFRPVQA